MLDEHYWAIIVLSALLTYILIKVVKSISERHFAEKRRIAEREILQKERLLAMEKGLPLPEWDKELLAGDLNDAANRNVPSELDYFRIVALCIGLLGVSGGIGMMLAFVIADFEEWPIGLLPVMMGIGLLLFHRLTGGRNS